MRSPGVRFVAAARTAAPESPEHIREWDAPTEKRRYLPCKGRTKRVFMPVGTKIRPFIKKR